MSIFTDYILPIGIGAAAGAAGYYGWLLPEIVTPTLACCAVQLFYGGEGKSIRKRIAEQWEKYCEKASAAWSTWKQPHIEATPATIARMTAEFEKSQDLQKLKKKVEELEQRIKDKKTVVKGLKSLAREPKDDVLAANKYVREVLERGPTKKPVAVKGASGSSAADLDDLAGQHIQNLYRQKFFYGQGGVVRGTWKPREASANIKEELEKLVGADEGQISKADRDAVWKKIRLAFPEL